MDLGFSEQQDMLRRVARQFLDAECPTTVVRELEQTEEGYSTKTWAKMGSLGWLGLTIPSKYGGEGGMLIDQVVLSEEIGRALLPGPFMTSSVLSGRIITMSDNENQKKEILRGISNGSMIVTTANLDTDGGFRSISPVTTATKYGEGYKVQGTKVFVPYANASKFIILPVTFDSGLALLAVDTGNPDIKIVDMSSIGGYRQCKVDFDNAFVPTSGLLSGPDIGARVLEQAKEWATLAQCGEILGRTEKTLEITVEYAKNRTAFGRPIGAFQAVQHRCANLRVGIDGLRQALYQATSMIDSGLACSEQIAITKAYAGIVSRLATETGHSIFAGIAFAVEHDMHLYTQRAKISEAFLGDTDFQLDLLAEIIGS